MKAINTCPQTLNVLCWHRVQIFSKTGTFVPDCFMLSEYFQYYIPVNNKYINAWLCHSYHIQLLVFVFIESHQHSTLNVASSADCLLQSQRLCSRLITHCFSFLLRFFPYCFFVSSIFFYSSLFLFFLIVCCRYSVSAKDWSPIGFFLLLRVLRFKCSLIVNTHSKYSIMLQSILLFPDKSTL